MVARLARLDDNRAEPVTATQVVHAVHPSMLCGGVREGPCPRGGVRVTRRREAATTHRCERAPDRRVKLLSNTMTGVGRNPERLLSVAGVLIGFAWFLAAVAIATGPLGLNRGGATCGSS